MDILINSRLRRWPFPSRILKSASLELVQKCFPKTSGEISIALVGSERMARINEAYLGHSGPTDVITFDYGEEIRQYSKHDSSRQCHEVLTGEIFICPEVAHLQGMDYGVEWRVEVLRYLVHGFLHLAGYDDHAAHDRRVMKAREDLLHNLILRSYSGLLPKNRNGR